ncbi:TIGR03546 family protein [Pseudofrancisella aestuarii]|uniref:TIGR03546 family protein n=1 Tax=Pseudofrancisella aestuarii TaxID=2670347 RepID=A0ABV9TA46_9GAMM|nr:TIGR03546 family protein [Pseudofrancisella aestuarii]
MMKKIYNKLMSTIFSQTTPAQLLLVSILGFVFGFIPGFSYAPLLFILTIFLVLILRVNIGIFIIIALIAKALSFMIEGLSFGVGTFLIDGFAQPLFKKIVNTPVLAYAGFDYYLVTGAFVVSIILGVVVGLILAKIYKGFVSKMAKLQAENGLYTKITSKLSTKIASKILLGKNISKVDWQKMAKKRFLQPFRILGVTLVAIIVALIYMSPKLLETTLVSNIIKQQLSKANGATVDYKSINLDFSEAKLEIAGLGAANPSDLHEDRFYAESVSASLNMTGILTKHLVLDNVKLDGVKLNKERSSKGELYGEKTQAINPAVDENINNVKTISGDVNKLQQLNLDNYLNNAKTASKVAKGIKQGAEVLSNFKPSPKTTAKEQQNVAKEEAKTYGYANVRAESLETKKPMLTILNTYINNYEDFGNIFNVYLGNISTNPTLLGEPTTIKINTAKNDDINANVTISNKADTANNVEFKFKNLGNNLVKGLDIQNLKLNAKNASISGKGSWNFESGKNISFNIPLVVNLDGVTADFNGFDQKLQNLQLNALLSGDLNNTNFSIDKSSIDNILKSVNVQDVANNIIEKTGADEKTKQLIKNTKINGKSISEMNANDAQHLLNTQVNGKAVKDLNANDVKNIASGFGINI